MQVDKNILTTGQFAQCWPSMKPLYPIVSPTKHLIQCWLLTPSPTKSVGVTNVRQGFSIPPYGKEGGRISKSYVPQA